MVIIFIPQTAVRFTYLSLKKLLLHFNSDPRVEITNNFRREQSCKANTAIWLTFLPETSPTERPDSVLSIVTVRDLSSVGTSSVLILLPR